MRDKYGIFHLRDGNGSYMLTGRKIRDVRTGKTATIDAIDENTEEVFISYEDGEKAAFTSWMIEEFWTVT